MGWSWRRWSLPASRACGAPQTTSRAAAHLTIDGSTHTTRPAECSQLQGYRTINIRDRDSQVEAVVLLSGYRVIPQWVKIRNVGGFTGSFWEGGVGDAHADVSNSAYTITGSAYWHQHQQSRQGDHDGFQARR